MKGKVNVYLHLISSLETPVYVSNFMVITIAGFNWIKNGKKCSIVEMLVHKRQNIFICIKAKRDTEHSNK
jgi:hypothetical protein